MECRSSGLTDKEWCEGKGIPQSTFYAWLKQVKQVDAEILSAHKKSTFKNTAPEIIRVDLPNNLQNFNLDDTILEKSKTSDQSYAPILVEIEGIKIHVSNNADPFLLAQTLKMIRGTLC
jgi:hypothetical protein